MAVLDRGIAEGHDGLFPVGRRRLLSSPMPGKTRTIGRFKSGIAEEVGAQELCLHDLLRAVIDPFGKCGAKMRHPNFRRIVGIQVDGVIATLFPVHRSLSEWLPSLAGVIGD